MNKMFLFLFLFFTSATVSAGGFGCSGNPLSINVWKGTGYISAKLSTHNKVWLICQIGKDPGCNAVLSILQTAKVTKSNVVLHFSDSTYKSCDSLPQWDPALSASFDYITVE